MQRSGKGDIGYANTSAPPDSLTNLIDTPIIELRRATFRCVDAPLAKPAVAGARDYYLFMLKNDDDAACL